MVAVHLIAAWNTRELVAKGYPDFTIFYSAGKMIRGGLAGRLYEEQAQYRTQREFASGVGIRMGALPYNHPPFEALIFVPLTFVPYLAAYFLWDAINVLILVALPFILRPYLPALRETSVLSWVFVSLAFFPVFIALLQGQDTLILLLLFALAFVSLSKNSDVAAGCWLGLGLFRFHLVLPIMLILGMRRRYKTVLGFAIIALALGLVSMAAIGVHETLAYPGYVLRVERSMALRRTVIPVDMPNIRGLVDLVFPVSGSRVVPDLLIGVVSVALLVFSIRKWERPSQDADNFDLGFALCVVVTILISYHAFFYDLSLLLLPISLFVNRCFSSPQVNAGTVLSLMGPLPVLFFTPLSMFLWKHNVACLMALVLLLWVRGISRTIGRAQSFTAARTAEN